MMDRNLRVSLLENGADAERLDVLTGYLQAELLHLDVDDVSRLPAESPPPGARAGQAASIGGLLITLGQASDSLVSAVRTVCEWLRRDQGGDRSVTLELDGDKLIVADPSAADQERLIELFISRHTQGDDGQCPASAKP